jgi:hypothetical protein
MPWGILIYIKFPRLRASTSRIRVRVGSQEWQRPWRRASAQVERIREACSISRWCAVAAHDRTKRRTCRRVIVSLSSQGWRRGRDPTSARRTEAVGPWHRRIAPQCWSSLPGASRRRSAGGCSSTRTGSRCSAADRRPEPPAGHAGRWRCVCLPAPGHTRQAMAAMHPRAVEIHLRTWVPKVDASRMPPCSGQAMPPVTGQAMPPVTGQDRAVSVTSMLPRVASE